MKLEQIDEHSREGRLLIAAISTIHVLNKKPFPLIFEELKDLSKKIHVPEYGYHPIIQTYKERIEELETEMIDLKDEISHQA